MSTIGRRPYRSEREPISGEHRNCITAQTATKMPLMNPACAFDPVNSWMSPGSTGMTMPSAMTSSTAVTRMNAIAAFRRGCAALAIDYD